MHSPSRRITGSLLFASLWVALAVLRPGTTFHFAPLIVAVWPGLGERDRARAVIMSLFGLVVAVVTTLLLAVTGVLEGPSLLPWGGPLVESLLAAMAGAALGPVPSLLRPAS